MLSPLAKKKNTIKDVATKTHLIMKQNHIQYGHKLFSFSSTALSAQGCNPSKMRLSSISDPSWSNYFDFVSHNDQQVIARLIFLPMLEAKLTRIRNSNFGGKKGFV